MPAKNALKKYDRDQMWHVYNRGVDKGVIFTDEKDYTVFLSYLKVALSPELDDDDKSAAVSYLDVERLRRLNLHGDVELVSYCLLPNHFHLQLYQHSEDGISKLMRSIATGYSMYFNKRHERSGTLFQGRYKASHVKTDDYWTHLSRYIHMNALDAGSSLERYKYSSYKYYVGEVSCPPWVNPSKSISQFTSISDYRDFCHSYIGRKEELAGFKEVLANH